MKRNHCKKIPWKYVIFVTFIPFGIFVHWSESDAWWNSLGKALCCAISSFFPSRGDYASSATPGYWIFHLLVVCFVAFVLFEYIIGKNLLNRLILFSSNIIGYELNVFWASNEESFCLASDFKKSKCRTVFVFSTEAIADGGIKKKLLEKVKRSCGLWIFGIPEDFFGIKSLCTVKQRHFFLAADSYLNVIMAKALVASIENKEIKDGILIEIYVRVSAEADDDVLYLWADECNEKIKNVCVYIVREEGVVSRDFLYRYPMLESPNIAIEDIVRKDKDKKEIAVCGEFRILLIGFGMQGQRLLNDMVCDAQFLNKSGSPVPLSVDVIDKDVSSFGWYEENCKVACSRYKIIFKRCDVKKLVFWKKIATNGVMDYNRIVVCTGDDDLNVRVANDISHVYKLRNYSMWENSVESKRPIVFARIRNRDISDIVDSLHCDGEIGWHCFGHIKSVYREDYVCKSDQGGWWRAAMRLNGLYCGKSSCYDLENWKKLSMFDKESSLASVFFQRNFLRMFGFDIKKGDKNFKSISKYFESNDWFAEIEHLRWMAFHFVRGVELWEPPKDECINGKKPSWFIKRHIRKHAALVEYSRLGEIDKVFETSLKTKDQDLLKGLEAIQYYFSDVTMNREDLNQEYIPTPENLDDVNLPTEVNEIIEELAKNVHEVWAKRRYDSGWRYGKCRNDRNKSHPSLVSYEKLNEEEKQYDRETVIGSLKLLYKKGFLIVKGERI